MLPMLMKIFMDIEKQPIIPNRNEEVLNFKAFVDGYLCSSNDMLLGHANVQQFKFYKDSNGWPMIQYKLLRTDNDWSPNENEGIWF
jgi:hypothetical protein